MSYRDLNASPSRDSSGNYRGVNVWITGSLLLAFIVAVVATMIF
jgi:hypothetical protein